MFANESQVEDVWRSPSTDLERQARFGLPAAGICGAILLQQLL